MKIVSVAQMRSIEKEADARGVSYARMMQTAGQAVAHAAAAHLPVAAMQTVLGLVGSGNNGGDALVALTTMQQAGWQASAYLARPRPADDNLLKAAQQAGVRVYGAEADVDFAQLTTLLQHQPSLLIDGVLGTGITLPLRAEIARLLAFIKNFKPLPFVVAVDCPSGVDCDSGAAAPETIPAQLTISMEAVKNGMANLPAFGLSGEIQVISLNLPDNLPTTPEIHTWMVDKNMLLGVLPPRDLDSHKGRFGTLTVAAGSLSYPGAAVLAGRAAYRVGTGVVQMAVPAPLQSMLAGHLPEAIWQRLPDEDGAISADAAQVLLNSLNRTTCLLLGPGLGQHPATTQFLRELLLKYDLKIRNIPLVLDADGLRLVSLLPNWPTLLPPQTILTPHPGEMSALTGLSTTEIQQDRLNLARQYARTWGHVVVLKGALTIVASPDGETCIIPVATPALAHAGTGDVLAGMIAGLRAQKVEAFEAAWAGAFLHGKAGLMAAQSVGTPAAVMASDVSSQIAHVLAEIY
jgi:ADP-dependent NAD(P)H-hydrate dehydratase / NAD(P)H-hydrate epimerase